MTARTAHATAPANFALSKYWGKRDEAARHPAVPSVSACISGLSAFARVTFSASATADSATLNGEVADAGTVKRLAGVLDAVRDAAGTRDRAHVESGTDFPVGAGLASSAAGLAAVAAAAWAAAGQDRDDLDAIANIARLGSGSACRSVHGGFVAWEPTDDHGSRVRAIAPASHWPLAMCLVRIHEGPKEIGSTDGMRRAQTSPAWPAWLATAPRDAATIEQAIRARDLATLATTAEANCLLMHATTTTARPPFFYFRPDTQRVLEAVQSLRESRGVPCFFTIDAGPNVKVFCEPAALGEVTAAMATLESGWPGRPGFPTSQHVVSDGVRFDD
ncbi:MAG: diphosphomevalonate decarboxylase [Planctomycetota bacterium]